MAESPGVLKNLPTELHYLIEPAMKYGRYQFDDDIFDFLDQASDREVTELAVLADRVLINQHYPEINKFLDDYPITDHEESARLYFLFGVMDAADLQFDRASDADASS